MSKTKVVMIVSVVFVVVACAALLLFRQFAGRSGTSNADFVFTDSKNDPSGEGIHLLACGYSSGGGMNGGHCFANLRGENGKVTLKIERLEYNGAREKKTTKRHREALLQEINALVTEADVKRMAEAPESELFLLDAPSSSLSFTFFDSKDPYGRSYSVHFDREQSEEDLALLRQIADLLLADG